MNEFDNLPILTAVDLQFIFGPQAWACEFPCYKQVRSAR